MYRHPHWSAVVSRGWAIDSACRLQFTLSCAVLCHIVSLQYLSRSSLHRLAGLHCRFFLSYGLQVVTREVHRSSLRRLVYPALDNFIFLFMGLILVIHMIRSKFISNQNSWIITQYNTTSKAPYILAELCTIAQT